MLYPRHSFIARMCPWKNFNKRWCSFVCIIPWLHDITTHIVMTCSLNKQYEQVWLASFYKLQRQTYVIYLFNYIFSGLMEFGHIVITYWCPDVCLTPAHHHTMMSFLYPCLISPDSRYWIITFLVLCTLLRDFKPSISTFRKLFKWGK